MGRILRVRNGNLSSTDGSESSQSSDVSKTKRCRTVLTDNLRNIRTRSKTQKENCTDSSSFKNGVIKKKVVNDMSNDKGGNNTRCTNLTDALSVDCTDVEIHKKNETERSVLVDKTNTILINKLNDSKSQTSDASKTKSCRTVLTDNSRNVRIRSKTQKENCTDSSSSKNGVVKKKVVNRMSNDKDGNNTKCTNLTDALSVDCTDVEIHKKNEAETSVLVDKTNTILINKLNDSKSQTNDASKTKRCRTVLTENSRNIRIHSKTQEENCTDSVASSEDGVVKNHNKKEVMNDMSNDKNGNNTKCTNLTDALSVGCTDVEIHKKEETENSVLVDKTNTVLRNKLNTSDSKTKHKVHFSSVDRIRKITQRRISDFFHVGEFHNHHENGKSPRSCQREHRKRILDCICHPDTGNSQELCGSNCTRAKNLNEMKHHIPIYNLPAAKGNNSFRLTPTQVKDKTALYDFEVDENEPVVNIKKRRLFKSTKKLKRMCRINDNLKSNEIINVPQRTMALRNDNQVNRVRIDYNEHNDSNVLDGTDSYNNPSSSNSNKNKIPVHSNATGSSVLKSKTNVINSNRVTRVSNKDNILKLVKPVKTFCNSRNRVADVENGFSKRIVGNVNKDERKIVGPATHFPNSEMPSTSYTNNNRGNKNHASICDGPEHDVIVIGENNVVNPNTSSCKSITNISRNALCSSALSDKQQNLKKPVPGVVNTSQLLQDLTAITSVSQSPLPEYSRIDDGIQVGPCYMSNLINCSDSEYNNNFLRGITASTPFRMVKSPARINRKNDHQVRLSGGEISNRFVQKLADRSDETDEDGNFFGFQVSESHDESWRYALSSRQKAVEQEPESNEPVQKITVSEVIRLLKQEVNSNSKTSKPKNKVTFQKNSYPNKDSSNSSGSEDSSSNNERLFSPAEPTIKEYIAKHSESELKKVISSPEKSFTKPPRRSYTSAAPRRTKRMNYRDDDATDEVEEEHAPKKPTRKKVKISKKEEKEMERLAAMMNSQFEAIDKFSLVVE